MSKKLNEMLQPEAYPYGLIRPFARAIKGQTEDLIEAFNCASFGQGANSRAYFLEAIGKIEDLPEVRKSGLMPFPFFLRKTGQTIIGQIPPEVARKMVKNFS